MSAGSRSGVHCRRRNSRPRVAARLRAASVLPESGNVLEQHVAAGQDGGQGDLERALHPHHHRAHLGQHLLPEPGHLGHCEGRDGRGRRVVGHPGSRSVRFPTAPRASVKASIRTWVRASAVTTW